MEDQRVNNIKYGGAAGAFTAAYRNTLKPRRRPSRVEKPYTIPGLF